MKKFLATVLAVMMMVTVMAVPAFAAEPGAHTVAVFDSDGNEITSDSVIYTTDTITVKVTAVGEETDYGEMGTMFGIKLLGTVDDFEVVSCTVDSVAEDDYTAQNYGDYAEYIVSGPLLATSAESTLEMVFSIRTDSNLSVTAYVSGETTEKTALFADGTYEKSITVQGPGEVDPGTGEGETEGETGEGETGEGETETPSTPEESTENSTNVTNDNIDTTPHASIDVVGNLDSNDNDIADKDETDPIPAIDPTIDVIVSWTDMEFNYSQEWNTTTLQYDWNWKNGEDYIKVENRSSVGVDATLSFTGATGYESAVEFSTTDAGGNATEMIAATWADNTMTLGCGNQIDNGYTDEDGDGVVAPTGTILVNVTEGTTMETTDDNDAAALWTTLGQITITVSKVTE